jgi:dephospho-CoA kinase
MEITKFREINSSSSMKFGSVIWISFPSNAQINAREMERDRETERQRDRETERQRDRETGD